MIETKQFGPVTQFIMGRLIDGVPIYTMACYYVDGLLIDTGPVHVSSEIEEVFADYPVEIIVNTHHHEDHIGNNIIFQETQGLGPVFAHHLAVPRIIKPTQWIDRLRDYQLLVWGTPPPSNAVNIPEQIRTNKYIFDVIYTPGHSDDHISLLEADQGWLFAGDLFLAEEVKTLRSDENVNEMLKSLNKLLDYNFNTLFCSSGRVVNNARQAVEAKIAYWEELGTKIRELYSKKLGIDEIRERLLGKETMLFEPTEGDFAKSNLVKSFLTNFE